MRIRHLRSQSDGRLGRIPSPGQRLFARLNETIRVEISLRKEAVSEDKLRIALNGVMEEIDRARIVALVRSVKPPQIEIVRFRILRWWRGQPAFFFRR